MEMAVYCTAVLIFSFSVPYSSTTSSHQSVRFDAEHLSELTTSTISEFSLNTGQAEALRRIAHMVSCDPSEHNPPITLIHGVFGAGKSFLLAIVVIFLVKLFQKKDCGLGDERYDFFIR